MGWMLWIIVVFTNVSGVFTALATDKIDDFEDLEEGRFSATLVEKPCRSLHLQSRYCRLFQLPALSFTQFEHLARRWQKQMLRTTAKQERIARSAFWLPEIALEWGQVNLQENASNWQAGQDFDSRLNQEYRYFWKIRASWNLRGIVRDPQQWQREKQVQMQLEDLQKKVDRIRKTYYQWFHEVLEYRRNPSLMRILRCEELEAELNSLTSGAFSEILGRGT